MRYMIDENLYRSLGYPCIDGIHGHMIAIVRYPSESQFGQITRAYNWSVVYIGQIHQYLCPLASLRILEGRILHLRIMSYGFEVSETSLLDVYLFDRHADGLHQSKGVPISTIGSSEPRHRNGNDVLTGQIQPVECLCTDDQCQCRVESARNPDYGVLRTHV